jgi:hypothetical protein
MPFAERARFIEATRPEWTAISVAIMLCVVFAIGAVVFVILVLIDGRVMWLDVWVLSFLVGGFGLSLLLIRLLRLGCRKLASYRQLNNGLTEENHHPTLPHIGRG